jgi:hypothetical protein
LLIEFRESVTIDICRNSSGFIKIISERDEDGLLQPIKVRKEAIAESLRLMTQGKFDDVTFRRQFRGKGSIVRVIDGVFHDRKIKLEEDVMPDWRGNRKIKVDIDGIKAVIEIHKLSL